MCRKQKENERRNERKLKNKGPCFYRLKLSRYLLLFPSEPFDSRLLFLLVLDSISSLIFQCFLRSTSSSRPHSLAREYNRSIPGALHRASHHRGYAASEHWSIRLTVDRTEDTRLSYRTSRHTRPNTASREHSSTLLTARGIKVPTRQQSFNQDSPWGKEKGTRRCLARVIGHGLFL
jgi:hypothetical protein